MTTFIFSHVIKASLGAWGKIEGRAPICIGMLCLMSENGASRGGLFQ